MKETRDDPVLSAIASFVREEQRDALADPRWESLAAGKATAEERAALDAVAARAPEAAGAPEVLAPLGAEAERRFAAAIQAAIQPPARARRWPVAVGALALAAGVALAVTRPWQSPEGRVPALELALKIAGRDRAEPADAVAVVRPGSTIVLTLRPERRVRRALGARVYLLRGDEATSLSSEIQPLDGGGLEVRVQMPVGPAASPGEAELAIIVAHPRGLPPEHVTRAQDALELGGRARAIHRRSIRIER